MLQQLLQHGKGAGLADCSIHHIGIAGFFCFFRIGTCRLNAAAVMLRLIVVLQCSKPEPLFEIALPFQWCANK
jgi:hypothetical protein